MSSLWWNSEVRVLSEATQSIGELKNIIENELRRHGFTDDRHNTLEVAGGKNGCWLSIAHFHIADRRFWEVVMASGTANDVTKNTANEVVAALHALRFL